MAFRFSLSMPRLPMARQGSNLSQQSQTLDLPSSEPQSPSSTSGGDSDELEDVDAAEPVLLPALASPSSLKPCSPWPFGSVPPRSRSDTLTQLTQPLTKLSTKDVSIASKLPHEILLGILKLVHSTSDLKNCIFVCKSWCQCGVELLWYKPIFVRPAPLIHHLSVLQLPEQTFPYAQFVRRINFSVIHDNITDHTLQVMSSCVRLERLTLSKCHLITDFGMAQLLSRCHNLVALDVSECPKLTNATCDAIAMHCKRLQGLNLGGCVDMNDQGIIIIAKKCSSLKRIKLRQLALVTDNAIIILARSCPYLLEIDLYGCPRISDPALWAIWRNLSHVRELTINGANTTNAAIPVRDYETGQVLIGGGHNQEELYIRPSPLDVNKDESAPKPFFIPLPVSQKAHPNFWTLIPPRRFEHIRVLDLTAQSALTDKSVEQIVVNMPRLRTLILAKCSLLTDESVLSICRLGRYLHYLHLGHCQLLTDVAVVQLSRQCTRLRYIDLACCLELSDMAVQELAALPRLKRIGLVRVTSLTDNAILALSGRKTLERIHLSYCENISVPAIHHLLQHLHRLTHLSLTGIPAFQRTDLQAYCRSPPKDFTALQQSAFCVYSGRGVSDLRRYLNAITDDEMRGSPDEPRADPPAIPYPTTTLQIPRSQRVPFTPHQPSTHNSHTTSASRGTGSAPAALPGLHPTSTLPNGATTQQPTIRQTNEVLPNQPSTSNRHPPPNIWFTSNAPAGSSRFPYNESQVTLRQDWPYGSATDIDMDEGEEGGPRFFPDSDSDDEGNQAPEQRRLPRAGIPHL